jgi:hypothetical protein
MCVCFNVKNLFPCLEPVVVDVEVDKRHECKAEEKAVDEAEDVSIVVDHREESDDEKKEHDDGEFEDLAPRVKDYVPVMDDLDKETYQDTKL